MNALLSMLPERLRRLVYDPAGPLTRELLLNPSRFGMASQVASRDADTIVKSVCGYCSTGCSLNVHLRDGRAVSITPAVDYPVNLGMACPKGWQALDVLDAPDRATMPLCRSSRREPLQPVSWSDALARFCRGVRAVQEQHGRASVAFLSTGQIPTEEMALLGALAKFGMGMVHGDGNTRQCMATAVAAYKESFGFDSPPFSYDDFEQSDVLVFVGANPCIAHPILWERVTRNRHQPAIIVIDPRVTETAAQATQHVALRPKGDLVLLYGLAHVLIANDWIDRGYIARHCSGFDELAEFLRAFTPQRVADEAGVPEADLHRLAATIAAGQRVSFWWTMGVNQSHEGVRTAQAIINLALLTGNIGRPGTGANSITGQCNAMGSRLFSNTTSLFAGRDFTNADHRREVADILSIPEDTIPRQPSWAYNEIIEGIRTGAIRGLWIVATNTAHSWINQSDVRELLGRLEFLVVQDMYHSTETAQLADLVLPAAGWGEKDGTFINSERRFGVTRAVCRAPGQALSDFRIFRLVAEAWGCGDLLREWTSPQAAFQILKALSAGRPCDITGIEDYAMLDRLGGVQWPCTAEDAIAIQPHGARSVWENVPGTLEAVPNHSESVTLESSSHSFQRPGRCGLVTDSARTRRRLEPDQEQSSTSTSTAALSTNESSSRTNERRLFTDGRYFHPDGKARFVFEAPRPVGESADDEYPFVLLTGRGTASQWHTQTRTAKSAVLRKLYPADVYVEVNSGDAGLMSVVSGDRVQVTSRRGQVTARAVVTSTVQPGQVFMPMHYDAVNQLTRSDFDPYSKQPSYKFSAVKLERCHEA